MWKGRVAVFFTILGLKRLLRFEWLAILAASLLLTIISAGVLGSPDWAIRMAVYVSLYSILSFVLLRYGLLATGSAMFFLNSSSKLTLSDGHVLRCCSRLRCSRSGGRWETRR